MAEAAKQESKSLPVSRWLETYGDESLVDAKLTLEGVEQCRVAAKHAADIDFHKVYVSPLRRTMETAYHVFKDHPNFRKIEFVLEPTIREKIGISGDIPLSNNEWQRSYDLVYKEMFEGRLDLTRMHPLLKRSQPWYFESLLPETQKQVSSKLQVYFKGDYTGALIDIIHNTWPERFESISNIKMRADNFRNRLIQFDLQDAQRASKVGVVGHSVFFKVYTAEPEFWEDVYCWDTNDYYPSDKFSLTMMNCEIHADRTILPHINSDE